MGLPLPAVDEKPVNGFGAPNADVQEPKAPRAGWMGCPNALVVVDLLDSPGSSKAPVPASLGRQDYGGLLGTH